MKVWVYMLILDDDSLYVGLTNNVQRRLKDHQEGIGSIFTRGRKIVDYEILWNGNVDNKYQGLLIENKQASDLKKQFPFRTINGGHLSEKYKKIVTKRAFTK